VSNAVCQHCLGTLAIEGGSAVLNIATLIVAPLLGLLGVYVGYILNARREDRTLRRELELEHYRAGQALFDELISSAGRRFVALQRWLWAVESPDAYEGVPVRATVPSCEPRRATPQSPRLRPGWTG